MKLRGAVLGFALVLAGGTIAGALGPESDELRPDPAVVSARELIERLEEQAEAQRAQLRETEACLERAKSLAERLGRRERPEGSSRTDLPEDEALAKQTLNMRFRKIEARFKEEVLAKLLADEARVMQQVEAARRLARTSSDPAVVHAERRLAEIREELRKEGREDEEPTASEADKPEP